MRPKPLCLLMLVFGDVARFVVGSVNASAVTHIGNCENSRGGLEPVRGRRGSLALVRRMASKSTKSTHSGDSA